MDKYISNKIKNISFVLTILVVFLHAYNLSENASIYSINSFIQNFISYGICTIAVPMFFMISGYLFFYNINPTLNEWIKKYKKRFKSLVIPFVVWCISWMLILYIVQLTSLGQLFFSNMIVNDFSIKQLFDYTFKYPIPFQLWYISDLIKLVIISPIIYYVVKFIGKVYAPIIIVSWIVNLIKFPLVFFSLGCYLAINYPKLDFKINSKFVKVIIVAFLTSVTGSVFIMNKEILLCLVRALGILSIWLGYDLLIKDKNKTFKYAEYAIFIYFFHEPLQSFLYRVVFNLINKDNITELILYVIVPITTILISVVLSMFAKKHISRFYAILTGGR